MSKIYVLVYYYEGSHREVVACSKDEDFLRARLETDVDDIYNLLVNIIKTGEHEPYTKQRKLNRLYSLDNYIWKINSLKDALKFYHDIIVNFNKPIDITKLVSIEQLCKHLHELGFDYNNFPDIRADIRGSLCWSISKTDIGDYLE